MKEVYFGPWVEIGFQMFLFVVRRSCEMPLCRKIPLSYKLKIKNNKKVKDSKADVWRASLRQSE